MNFLDLGLSEQTVRAVNECGIEKPTTVQTDVIPAILQGKDIFTIAPGGCGKTISYVLPLIDIICRKNRQNILIMTSDSQKSVMISDQLARLSRFHEENETDADGENASDVIIGSPDLLTDLVKEGQIDLSKINILVVDDINLIDLEHEGPIFEHNPYFPDRTNVEFAQIYDNENIRMRVWERGSGITQACGTGACATFVAAVHTKRIERKANIIMDGGTLEIEWKSDQDHLFMTGPATKVFEGTIELEL